MQWIFAESWVFFYIILEGDAVQIVRAVKLVDKSWSKTKHLID